MRNLLPYLEFTLLIIIPLSLWLLAVILKRSAKKNSSSTIETSDQQPN